jgi:hypothetical protein
MKDYGLDVPSILATNPGLDPHDIPEKLAAEIELLRDALSTDAVQAYAAALDPGAFEGIVDAIRQAA